MSGRQCDRFDEQLDALAVGDLSEPERGAVLAHVATCDACRRQLDELIAIADGLLELAPEHEPPPGFESRVLDRLAGSGLPVSRRRRGGWMLAAAAVLVVVAAGVALWGLRGTGTEVAVVRSGTIVGADGARLGAIELVRDEHPYVLVVIDHPRPGGDVVTCELEMSDGRTLVAGAWGYDDVRSGVWAVGIDASTLDAVRMRIVGADGDVLATAELG